MSGSSSRNSGSPQKGFFKRMLGQDLSRGAKHSEVRQRHPGFTVSNESMVTPGRMVKPQEAVISSAVRQLNREGYAVYNTPEKQDIYIAVQPDSAFFEDEEPEMVRMAGGSFVGAGRQEGLTVMTAIDEEEQPRIEYSEPADIFSNASRREEYEEIDFNEIIIKENESFEEEIEQAPMLFEPAFGDVTEPIIEESFRISSVAVAETSTGLAAAPEESYAGYLDLPEYEAEVIVEEVQVTDVPAGLYVDGYKPIDNAVIGIEEPCELSSFMEMSMSAETAVTSEAAAPVMMDTEILPMFAEDAEEAPAPEEETVAEAVLEEVLEEETATEIAIEEVSEEETTTEAVLEEVLEEETTTEIFLEEAHEEETTIEVVLEEESETVADIPIEVDDPVADIMKLTIPGLHMGDELISELTQDWETAIPEDGLESYDCRFMFLEAPAKEDAPCGVSFGFEGNESAVNTDPSVNFRF